MEDDNVSEIISQISEILKLSIEESYQLIKHAFDGENPAENLLEIIGEENIEIIHEILERSDIWLNTRKEIEKENEKYIEYVIPKCETIHCKDSEIIPTSRVGKYSKCFDYDKFNTVQSRVFCSVYERNENVLVAAPTGCGKTDIALLAILRAVDNGGKSVYIAPMKALASEICNKYRRVMSRMGFKVVEYTGDSEVEIGDANRADVVVCTPEKYEVATRRLSGRLENIRLVVLDEVHLLGEERGAVLETVVARLYRTSELEQRPIRLMGLSATLPNYREVSIFLKARDVFYFDRMYRPVPLKMTVVGFKKK